MEGRCPRRAVWAWGSARGGGGEWRGRRRRLPGGLPIPPGLGPRNIRLPTLSPPFTLQTEAKPYKPRALSTVTSTARQVLGEGLHRGPPPQPAARCCVRAMHMAEREQGAEVSQCGASPGRWGRESRFPAVPRPGAGRSHGIHSLGWPPEASTRTRRVDRPPPPGPRYRCGSAGRGAPGAGREHCVGSTGPRQGCGEHRVGSTRQEH